MAASTPVVPTRFEQLFHTDSGAPFGGLVLSSGAIAAIAAIVLPRQETNNVN